MGSDDCVQQPNETVAIRRSPTWLRRRRDRTFSDMRALYVAGIAMFWAVLLAVATRPTVDEA